jgi:hypothetical protein
MEFREYHLGTKRMKKTERIESMGWMTESAILPKKAKPIEGVTTSSLVELKASVYEREEQLKHGVEPVLKKAKASLVL